MHRNAVKRRSILKLPVSNLRTNDVWTKLEKWSHIRVEPGKRKGGALVERPSDEKVREITKRTEESRTVCLYGKGWRFQIDRRRNESEFAIWKVEKKKVGRNWPEKWSRFERQRQTQSMAPVQTDADRCEWTGKCSIHNWWDTPSTTDKIRFTMQITRASESVQVDARDSVPKWRWSTSKQEEDMKSELVIVCSLNWTKYEKVNRKERTNMSRQVRHGRPYEAEIQINF